MLTPQFERILEDYTFDKGRFIFERGDDLKEKIEEARAPQKPGIYLIMQIDPETEEETLLYIGKSGVFDNGAKRLMPGLLVSRILKRQEKMPREEFFETKLAELNIRKFAIYWYTIECRIVNGNEIPEYLPEAVKGLLMQAYYEAYRELPAWHKTF